MAAKGYWLSKGGGDGNWQKGRSLSGEKREERRTESSRGEEWVEQYSYRGEHPSISLSLSVDEVWLV